jgi:pilus assembly protein CpaF
MKLFVYTGMNVLFAGPVRSGKTTFLRIWQSYEDPKLEGAAVATDPETDWYSIMPEAPVMQLVADGPKLEGIIRPLMRGDNDYIILEEMRDAEAFRTALEIASVSTGRCKATVHTNDASVLPFMMAEKIRQRYGGNTEDIERRIAESFDLAFEMRQTEDNRAEKKLTAITQYYTDPETGVPVFSKLMEYDNRTGKWYWNRRLSPKIIRKLSAFPKEMRRIMEILKELEEGRR